MRGLGTPVLDNHLHIDPRNGRGIEAVKDFARSGGTHLLIVNKPSWHYGIEVTSGEDFRAVFEETIETVETASSILRGRAWPVLGVHPALISRLIDERGFEIDEAKTIMIDGLEIAGTYADSGATVALKSGRPHYDVSEPVSEASADIIRHALKYAADAGVCVQLHTEQTEDLTTVAHWGEEVGLQSERIVKHYAHGPVSGVTPSVMSKEEYLERVIETNTPFLMETDFVDDPDRPGAVMGPKTVPRRVHTLLEAGQEDAIRRAHVETPRSVYGIDMKGTLDSS